MIRERIRQMSIRERLILLGMVPSVIIILVGASLFAIYDYLSFRQRVSQNFELVASFIASSTRVALPFDEVEFAQKVLSGLQAQRQVTAAAIYDREGKVFAFYPDSPHILTSIRRMPKIDNIQISSEGIQILKPIKLEETTIGHVYIEGNFLDYWRRLQVLLIGTGGGIILLTFGAYALASQMQRHISGPVNKLAETARKVWQEKNYSARVAGQSMPELASLTAAFNEMLEKIEERTTQVESANKELEAFNYTVSHDLRGPLRIINSYAQILSKSHGDSLPADGRQLLDKIQINIRRMGGLIDDLLAFSRVDAEQFVRREVDLDALANQVFKELEAGLNGQQVVFSAQTGARVLADESLLTQALQNLLSNALKYSRKRPVSQIELGTVQNDGKPIYYVRDNGVGFDMRFANKLFGIFQRLHHSSEFEGTGVGLAIVERIIARHGGKIWAEADVDKGATFYFTLGANS